jgi:DNA invertase Pin-like site-specific DNA recombinase
MAKEMQRAVAYLRTSSAANIGADKDSDKRQRAAIEAFAGRVHHRGGVDAAVSGADRVDQRPGFVEICNGSRRTAQRLSSWSRPGSVRP